MAARSLGSLTIDLIMKIGGFTQGATQAERQAARTARELSKRKKGDRAGMVHAGQRDRCGLRRHHDRLDFRQVHPGVQGRPG
ncbi:hypothetical protein LJR039_005404 [Pseudorhodoferax sp. LjRoot39]|uniref:hypothetical protein n=1 Tax=Pseudorhodoferax sp. LjRoot39 TaxID=3342328 RepID=UPI003ED0BA8C